MSSLIKILMIFFIQVTVVFVLTVIEAIFPNKGIATIILPIIFFLAGYISREVIGKDFEKNRTKLQIKKDE